MNDTFADRLKSGPPQIGTLVSMSSLDAIDVLAACGFNWLFLDLEHSSLSTGEAKALLQVIAGRVPVLPRVAANDPLEIKKALDLGCAGVIVPQVSSRQEAEDAVRWAKYPPEGERSVGIGRAHGYGINFQTYVDGANAQTSVIVQIEHIKAVENLPEIISVPGVDAVFIGPYDFSGSLGLLGQVTHARVQEAVQRVRAQCSAAGVPYGIFAMTAEACARELAEGAALVVMGVDTMHLYQGARSQLEIARAFRAST